MALNLTIESTSLVANIDEDTEVSSLIAESDASIPAADRIREKIL
jgi:hypothetical protein